MIKKIIGKNNFIKNVLTLMSGAIIAQAIPFLILPFIARIYSPEDFGVLTLYLAIVSTISVVATGRYEMAIVLPKKNKVAINIFSLAILISFFVSILLLIIIFFFENYFLKLINNSNVSRWIYLIPFAVLVAGIHQSLNYWFVRRRDYKKLATNKVLQSSVVSGSNLTFGLGGLSSSGLILGQFFGNIISTSNILISFFKEDWRVVREIKLARVVFVFRRYISFLKFGVPALLTSSLASQSFFILINIYLGSTILGFSSLIMRLVGVPSMLLGSSLGDVFYREISEISKKDSFIKIENFTKKLAIYSILLYIALYFFLDSYFVLIFGVQWIEAVVYIKYILIVSAFAFVFSPLSVLFNYFELQNYNLIWQISWLLSNVILFVLYEFYGFSIEVLFLLYTLKQSLLYLFGIFFFLFHAKRVCHEN